MYVPPSSRFQGVDGKPFSLFFIISLLLYRSAQTNSLLPLSTGAFFGTTFPHLLFQTYPSALPFPSSTLLPNPDASTSNRSDAPAIIKEPTTPSTSLAKVYIPRIYGFKVSEKARSGPRMIWLRMRVS